MREIVGAMIGTRITNNRQQIMAAVDAKTVTRFLDREHMQFMSACDLGRGWDLMAAGPTYFYIDDKGELHPPTPADVEQQRAREAA